MTALSRAYVTICLLNKIYSMPEATLFPKSSSWERNHIDRFLGSLVGSLLFGELGGCFFYVQKGVVLHLSTNRYMRQLSAKS